jgi:hypothetical protein
MRMAGRSISSADVLGGATRAQLLGDMGSMRASMGEEERGQELEQGLLPRSPLNITTNPGSVSISVDLQDRQLYHNSAAARRAAPRSAEI